MLIQFPPAGLSDTDCHKFRQGFTVSHKILCPVIFSRTWLSHRPLTIWSHEPCLGKIWWSLHGCTPSPWWPQRLGLFNSQGGLVSRWVSLALRSQDVKYCTISWLLLLLYTVLIHKKHQETLYIFFGYDVWFLMIVAPVPRFVDCLVSSSSVCVCHTLYKQMLQRRGKSSRGSRSATKIPVIDRAVCCSRKR